MEENKNKKKKKQARAKLNLNALPEEPVELTCPLCGYEGDTILKKSWGDRCKILIFYSAVTIFIVLFFVFILAYMILHMIICNRDKCKGSNCCSCKSMYGLFGKCQPKVHQLHFCAACKKQIGQSK